MRFVSYTSASRAIGFILVLAAVVLPPLALLEYLGVTPSQVSDKLLLGATLFRFGLGLLGLSVVALGSMPIWRKVNHTERSVSAPRGKLGLSILGAILLAALGLRLYHLNSGLWFDEIVTNVLYARMPFGSILTSYESENQHFLYSLLAHASFNLFGETAWALRLPAVLFGVASIWGLYLLGCEVANRTEALLASALLTFSYTHVWFSQNARGYSGLLFLAILSSYLFLRACREARPQTWLLYAISVALGLYIHVTMAFVIISHFLIFLWGLATRRRTTWTHSLQAFSLGFGFAGLLSFQLYALVLPQVVGGMGREASVVEAWKNPIWTILELLKGMQISFAGSVMASGALLVLAAGTFSYARSKPVVIQLLVIPAFIGATVVIALGHHLWPRFFFFATGFGALVVIRGAMVFGHQAARMFRLPSARAAWVGTALCLAMILVSMISIPAAYGPKQDYLGAADFVEANKEPGDAVVVAGLAAFPYKKLYYKDWEEAATVEDLSSIRSRAKRTWMIYTFPPVLEAMQPGIVDSIKREFKLVGQFDGTVGGGTIFVSRSDSFRSELVGK